MVIIDFDLETILAQQADSSTFTYLAAPYSHFEDVIVEQRVAAIDKAAARLFSAGVMLFSPISQCHPIAKAGKLPGDFEFWKRYNKVMLTAASSMTLLKLGGWHESSGIAGELGILESQKKPVYMLDPLIAFDLGL